MKRAKKLALSTTSIRQLSTAETQQIGAAGSMAACGDAPSERPCASIGQSCTCPAPTPACPPADTANCPVYSNTCPSPSQYACGSRWNHCV